MLIGSQSKCLPCIYSNTVEGSLIFFSLDGFVAIEPNGEHVYIILSMQRYLFCERKTFACELQARRADIWKAHNTVNASIDVQTTRDSEVNRLQRALLRLLWCEAPIRLGMWWFTFISSQLNKRVRGGGGGRAADWKRERSRVRAPIDSTVGRMYERFSVWTKDTGGNELCGRTYWGRLT